MMRSGDGADGAAAWTGAGLDRADCAADLVCGIRGNPVSVASAILALSVMTAARKIPARMEAPPRYTTRISSPAASLMQMLPSNMTTVGERRGHLAASVGKS